MNTRLPGGTGSEFGNDAAVLPATQNQGNRVKEHIENLASIFVVCSLLKTRVRSISSIATTSRYTCWDVILPNPTLFALRIT